ncbi:hypothetical protein GOBAR_DD24588 [Gossypium barbadense]|nr:hypothetical protein GOBAR_DD24588 [Gossypium barbadense]
MKSLSSASFLLLSTVVFHLFSSAAAVETDAKPPIISKGDSKLSQSDGRKFCVSKPEASDAQLKKKLGLGMQGRHRLQSG